MLCGQCRCLQLEVSSSLLSDPPSLMATKGRRLKDLLRRVEKQWLLWFVNRKSSAENLDGEKGSRPGACRHPQNGGHDVRVAGWPLSVHYIFQ